MRAMKYWDTLARNVSLRAPHQSIALHSFCCQLPRVGNNQTFRLSGKHPNTIIIITKGYKVKSALKYHTWPFQRCGWIFCLFSNRDNCEKELAKVFRQYYRRPYFLPPMAEASEGNWFIVSSGENKTLNVRFCRSSFWQSRGGYWK